jgi:hypothetical protein
VLHSACAANMQHATVCHKDDVNGALEAQLGELRGVW